MCLAELHRAVEHGETVTITRHVKAVAHTGCRACSGPLQPLFLGVAVGMSTTSGWRGLGDRKLRDQLLQRDLLQLCW